MERKPIISVFVVNNGFIVDVEIASEVTPEQTNDVSGMLVGLFNAKVAQQYERRTFVESNVEGVQNRIKEQLTGLVVPNVWREG